MVKNDNFKACPACGELPKILYTFPKIRDYGEYDIHDPIYHVYHHCKDVDYSGPRAKLKIDLVTHWNEYCNELEYDEQYEIDREINFYRNKYIELLANKIVENTRRYKDAE
jgi:hypothetical protein